MSPVYRYPRYTTCTKVSDFSLHKGVSYKRLCDFSHLPKTGNYVITWRGVKNFNRKPQLVGGGKTLGRLDCRT